MPAIHELGHVGVFVKDLQQSARFYTEMLGLQVTDHDETRGMVFLSARPDTEHHEIVLMRGRDGDAKVLQQLSFRCARIEDVLEYYERFVTHDVPINMTMTHGNALGVYFADPDGNNCEVYWRTGLDARQPFLRLLDFTNSPDELLDQVRRAVAEYGETGVPGTRRL